MDKNKAYKLCLTLSTATHVAVLFYTFGIQEIYSVTNPSEKSLSIKIRPDETKISKPVLKPREDKKKVKKEVTKKAQPVQEQQPQQKTIITNASTMFSPQPTYPRQARLRGIEGQVRLRLGINGLGIPVVIDLIESSGHELLDQAAITGLQKWRFEVTDQTQAISFWTEKTIGFELK